MLGARSVIIGIIFLASASSAPFLAEMWEELAAIGIGAGLLVIILILVAIFSAIVGILSLLGGIYAIKRKKWGLVLAGSIAAIFSSTALGVLSTIFTAIAKNEFE